MNDDAGTLRFPTRGTHCNDKRHEFDTIQLNPRNLQMKSKTENDLTRPTQNREIRFLEPYRKIIVMHKNTQQTNQSAKITKNLLMCSFSSYEQSLQGILETQWLQNVTRILIDHDDWKMMEIEDVYPEFIWRELSCWNNLQQSKISNSMISCLSLLFLNPKYMHLHPLSLKFPENFYVQELFRQSSL